MSVRTQYLDFSVDYPIRGVHTYLVLNPLVMEKVVLFLALSPQPSQLRRASKIDQSPTDRPTMTKQTPTTRRTTGLLSDKYTEKQLRDALASLDPDDADPTNELNVTRGHGHLYGYVKESLGPSVSATANTSVDASLFTDDHQLSVLQEITAHRCLDYETLMVSNDLYYLHGIVFFVFV